MPCIHLLFHSVYESIAYSVERNNTRRKKTVKKRRKNGAEAPGAQAFAFCRTESSGRTVQGNTEIFVCMLNYTYARARRRSRRFKRFGANKTTVVEKKVEPW